MDVELLNLLNTLVNNGTELGVWIVIYFYLKLISNTSGVIVLFYLVYKIIMEKFPNAE